jgi:hypothetical protein
MLDWQQARGSDIARREGKNNEILFQGKYAPPTLTPAHLDHKATDAEAPAGNVAFAANLTVPIDRNLRRVRVGVR